MPSRLAQLQVEHELARSGRGPSLATVWTWGHLWREVRARRGQGPLLLSTAATRSVFNEAIDATRRSGTLKPLGEAVDSPGFRHRLRGRIGAWMRSGRDAASAPPSHGPIAEAEWAIFATYRRLLGRLGVEDEDGLARWAAGILHADPPKHFREPLRLRVIEPPGSRDAMIALDSFHAHARDLAISLVHEPDAARADLFRADSSIRDRLLGQGFVEQLITATPRPEALDHLGRNLFREPLSPPTRQTGGMSFLGAPGGSGEALMIARRSRDLLDSGVTADEIVIVAAQHDETTLLVVETLRDWGIAAHSVRSAPLANDPGLAALRSAAQLPVEGWDAESLARLLRHGAIQLAWPEAEAPLALATAATAVTESRSYRGEIAILDAILDGSRMEADADKPETRSRARRAARASTALPLIDRLMRTIGSLAGPGSWPDCVDRLFALSEELGLANSAALDILRLALDDQGEVLRRLGRGSAIWSWAAFVAELTATIRDLGGPEVPTLDRSIPIIEPRGVAGVTCRHLILFKLGEGAFASADSIEQDDEESVSTATQRDMLTFFRAVNAPSDGLTLVYPTADASGQELLPAGFLDDVRTLLTVDALKSATRSVTRLDAVLPADLALAPHEARVRAVARACLDGDRGPLERLAGMADNRGALDGAARALRLAHWRDRRGRFDRFEGHLSDPRIIERLTHDFAATRRPFSASQLESLALCPFQFFQKYVLCLEPPEERRELDEDHATRGSLLHCGLESLHAKLRDVPDTLDRAPAERVKAVIAAIFDQVLAEESEPRSAIAGGLFAIESERLRRTARRYARQFRDYAEEQGRHARAEHLEFAFGGTRGTVASLTLGEGDATIRVDGFIDRIDMLDRDGRSLFRVIDYKAGHVPTPAEIAAGLALQLPLYAMAAQRTLFTGVERMPLDAGYWGLKEDGFKPKRKMSSLDGDWAKIEDEWRAFSGALERYVIALVERLKHGDLPVHPRKPDCERFCDYRSVCRIKQARRGPKIWSESPTLEDRA